LLLYRRRKLQLLTIFIIAENTQFQFPQLTFSSKALAANFDAFQRQILPILEMQNFCFEKLETCKANRR